MSFPSIASSFQAYFAPEPGFSILSRLKGLAAAFAQELRIRRALREAGALGEEALHDIGISPGSVEDAVRYGRR